MPAPATVAPTLAPATITAETIPFTPEPLSEAKAAWLKERKTGIGGSDAPAILGLCSYRSIFQVWQDKTNPDQLEGITETERMYWGTANEHAIALAWSRRTGKKIHRQGIVRSQTFPFILASIDRKVEGERAGLECKNRDRLFLPRYDEDGPSLYEQIQVQHYMAATGYGHWYLAVLFGGNTLRAWRIPRDDEVIAVLIREESAFWEAVQAGEPRDEWIDGSKHCGEYLQDTYPRCQRETLEMDDDAREWFSKYLVAKEAEADWGAQKREAENRIKAMLGESGYGECANEYRASWTDVKPRTTVDAKALKTAHPEIYEQFTKTGKPARRFVIKRLGAANG